MKKAARVIDCINVAARYQRSVNLSHDWKTTESLDGYVITPNVLNALATVCEGLKRQNGQRAFSLIGHYGAGKSAFTVFLSKILSKDRMAEKALLNVDTEYKNLAADFACLHAGKAEGFLTVPVTARRQAIGRVIVEAFLEAFSRLNKTRSVQNCITAIQKSLENLDWKDTKVVSGYLEKLERESSEQGYSGILLMVDEAGKTLEYALQDRESGDIQIFQEISELANRKRDFPVLFIITLHQMFSDYVDLVDRNTQQEWNKVQERFQTIQFAESAAATVRLIGGAFHKVASLPQYVSDKIEAALKIFDHKVNLLPVGLNRKSFEEIAWQAWPLHPATLLAMPHLFRRLAQNERSVFSYLNSSEHFGLQEKLAEALNEKTDFVRLHHLYSYLMANFEAGLARLPHAKRLLEANDVINSRHSLSEEQVEIIKTVAILNVLGEMCPLRATATFISCSMPPEIDVVAEIEKLRQQSIFTYRQLDQSYRVWEGSDVDIEARLKEARRNLQIERSSMLTALQKFLPERLFVARRHSLEKGSQRYFSIAYTEKIEKPETYEGLKIQSGASGQILVLLTSINPSLLLEAALNATSRQKRLIIAIPKHIDVLRSVAEELACLRWVEDNTEELRDDRVSRRELSLRLVQAEQKIFELLQALLDPRPAPTGNACQWFWNGKIQQIATPVDVNRLVSKACDELYSESPVLRNELVARSTISTQAASARRILMEKILTQPHLPKLGIEGFPPERSIYESVLRNSAIHYYDAKNKIWYLQAPPEKNKVNLRPVWDLIESNIFTEKIEKIDLQNLFNRLAQPPFGLPEGIHPILFTAFYAINRDDLFLYREGSFIPEPTPGHFELLQRRPELFKISGARLDGIRKVVVERIARGLDTQPKTAAVVRALFRVINSLPPVTMKSSKLADKAAEMVREAFVHAQSPEELLFTVLPEIFGMRPFLHLEKREADIDKFFAGLNNCLRVLQEHAPNVRKNARNILLQKCGLPTSDTGWEELERRAVWLSPRLQHEILTPFLKAVTNGIADNHNPMPALSCISNRPFEHWSDTDVERFGGLAEGVASIFRQNWLNFGNVTEILNDSELEEKRKVRGDINRDLLSMRERVSSRVLCAALRELLGEIEEQANQETATKAKSEGKRNREAR